MSHQARKRLLSPYDECARCGEWHPDALATPTGDEVLCLACRDTRHRRGFCPLCGQIRPMHDRQGHHVASRRQAPLRVPICVNCHAILTARQWRWHPAWRTELWPRAFLVQGMRDMLALVEDRRAIVWHAGGYAHPFFPLWHMSQLLGIHLYHAQATISTAETQLVRDSEAP